MDENRLGIYLKEKRLELGISQNDLGKMIGASQQQIYQYESGKRKPRLESILKLANALHLNLLEIDNIFPIFDSDFSSSVQSRIQDSINQTEELLKNLGLQAKIEQAKDTQIDSTTDNTNTLLGSFFQLNEDGQRVAVERVQELTEIQKYKKQDTGV